MSVKFKDILNSYNSSPIIRKDENFNKQLEKETNFMTEQKQEHFYKGASGIVKHINPDKLKEYINYKFYNAKVLELISEISDTIIYGSEDNVFMRDAITKTKQMGSDSVMGIALSATFKNMDKVFVVKVPRDPEENLVHEFFVGNQLNKLRYKIPNFSYVYGMFACTSPLVIDAKIPYGWCLNTGKPTNYIIYENIQPSVSMKEYIATCSYDEYMNIFLQVLFSLNMAYEQLGFTHYDLHCDNVLIRKLDNPTTLTYEYKGKKYYIKTSLIATIIDYGFGRVTYNDEIYSYNGGIEFYGIDYSKPSPINDIYKLLTHSIVILYRNKSFYDKLLNIFNLIVDKSNGDIEELLKNLQSTYFLLPNNLKDLKITNKDIIDYILKSKYEFLTDQPKTKVLSCDHEKCENTEQIKENIYTEQYDNHILNIYYMIKFNDEYGKAYIKNNKDTCILLINNELVEIVNTINTIISTKNIDYDISEIHGIHLTEKVLQSISERYIESIKLYEQLEIIKEKIDIYKYILDFIGDYNYNVEFDKFKLSFEQEYNKIYNIYKNNKDKINKIKKDMREFSGDLLPHQADFIKKFN